MSKQSFNISDYIYELPNERIAKYPIPERDQSKLLVYKNQDNISDYSFNQLPSLLPPNSLLIFNNTRVICARLPFQKETGAHIEIFCLSPHQPIEYQTNLSSTSQCQWKCLVGNLKKWKNEVLNLTISENKTLVLNARKLAVHDGEVLIEFSWNQGISFARVLHEAGQIPIPPYLQRQSEEIDKTRYQTIYSKFEGSVAAPTAGLHFTENTLRQLQNSGHQTLELTLHVGAGTFVPVKINDFRKHKMHEEKFIINLEFLKKIASHKNVVIPVGTTSLRTLESIHWLGIKTKTGEDISVLHQWEYTKLDQHVTFKESVQSLISFMESKNQSYIEASTGIMITPSYKFKVADAIITNFHQPGSTLLLLIAAFIGENWKEVYHYALKRNFRFLSYGDSSLLYRNKTNL